MSTDQKTLLTDMVSQQQGVEGKRQRRKLTQQQIDALELNFTHEHKLDSERKESLAIQLGLEPSQVAKWFQNRRVRYKSQKLEDEFSKLKAQHDIVVAENCQLQLEIQNLKDQIADAERNVGVYNVQVDYNYWAN